MGWEEKTANKITFDTEGMEVMGRITEVRPTELGVKSYTIEKEDGELVTFLGTTVLDRVMADELNSLVKIVYNGEAPTSRGFKVKQFDVYVWREEEVVEAEEKKPKK